MPATQYSNADDEDIEEVDFGSGQPLHAADAARRLLAGGEEVMKSAEDDDEEESSPPAFASAAGSSNSSNDKAKSAPKLTTKGSFGSASGSSSLFERIRQQQQKQQSGKHASAPSGSGYKAPMLQSSGDSPREESASSHSSGGASTLPKGLELEQNQQPTSAKEGESSGSATRSDQNGGTTNDDSYSFAPIDNSSTAATNSYSYASPAEPPTSMSNIPPHNTTSSSFEPMMIMSSMRSNMRSVSNTMKKLMHSKLPHSHSGDDDEYDNASPLLMGRYHDEELGEHAEYSMKTYFVTFCRDLYGFTLGRMSLHGRIAFYVCVGLFLVWILVR